MSWDATIPGKRRNEANFLCSVLPPEGHPLTAFPASPRSTLSQLDPCTLDSSPNSQGTLIAIPAPWVASLPQRLPGPGLRCPLTPVVATRQSATGTLTESLTISAAASVEGPLMANPMNDCNRGNIKSQEKRQHECRSLAVWEWSRDWATRKEDPLSQI